MSTSPSRRLTVAVIGTGLIGTSVALALLARAKRRRAPRLIGWDRSRGARRAAEKTGAFQACARSLAEAVADADIVVLATPLEAVIALLPKVIGAAKRGALVLDVAGVKRPVIAAARRALAGRPDVEFVSGHPLAGRETSGAAAARASLFQRRPFALVAPEPVKPRALSRASRLVRTLGAIPVVIKAGDHDRIVAASSALPQIVSVALALAVDRAAGAGARRLAGPGYADTTRLAGTPYGLWAAALTSNKPLTLRAVREFQKVLRSLEAAVRRGDARRTERLFRQAAAARRRVAHRFGQNDCAANSV